MTSSGDNQWLPLAPGPVSLSYPVESISFFKFEIPWDSSLHNSKHLDRVTYPGDLISIQLYVTLQLEGFEQAVSLQKELLVAIYNRASKTTPSRSIWSQLFSNKTPDNPDMNQCSGVYELLITPIRNNEEEENAAAAYVRGEENIKDWRPRSSSLIEEHFKKQNKLLYIQEVQKNSN
ncbi:kinesin-like protein unc-104 [Dendronephthya gigantea]|uniref:kinesin-like protein unc-104 n=1 Tax=Dendronephthya gigantea TaxID=151771 RepID=UPI00106A1A72|nr:kinesin-like protein unc-104 [Dendronephthya gigantea]